MSAAVKFSPSNVAKADDMTQVHLEPGRRPYSYRIKCLAPSRCFSAGTLSRNKRPGATPTG